MLAQCIDCFLDMGVGMGHSCPEHTKAKALISIKVSPKSGRDLFNLAELAKDLQVPEMACQM